MRSSWPLVAVAMVAIASPGCSEDSTDGAGGAASGGAAAGGAGTGATTQVTVAVDSDIAEEGRTNYARDVAGLISSHSPAVAAVLLGGDNARYDGSGTLLSYYQTYWQPANEADWGQFDAISFPQLGNHEYNESDAEGYFDYFANRLGAIASLPGYSGQADVVGAGWYSVNLNGWHLVSLNSDCSEVGGCDSESEQGTWLAADLAAHANMPLMAIWHAPRHTCGGGHSNATEMQDAWAALYAAHADLVFNGHNHFYQRWKPLNAADPDATEDPNGIVEITVGSGGVSTYDVCSGDERIAAQVGGDESIGVLFLTIGSDGSYSFAYQLRSDGSIFDSGAGVAHNAP